MLKNRFHICFFIYIIGLKLSKSEYTSPLRQKMILSLSQDLFVKNIIVLKPISLSLDANAISLAKKLSELNIYHSFLSANETKNIMDDSMDPKTIFSKTLILTWKEELNKDIFGLISENEITAWKFLWLVWNNKNGSIARNQDFYFPYNSQLLIAEDKIVRNKNVSFISEIYHPRILSPVMFKRHFGVWSENKGLEIPERDLYKRRLNLNGTNLNILVNLKQRPSLVWFDILSSLEIAMNFWWNFIILNDIAEQKAEYEINLSTRIYDPESVRPGQTLGLLWKEKAYMYIRYDEILEEHDIVPYLRPFSVKLWWAILISTASIGTCTLIIVCKNKSNFGLISSCYHSFEAITNQGGNTAPKSTPIRITIIIARLVAMIIVPLYSGFLLNYILFPNIKLPFTDIVSLVKDGSYKIGFPTSSNFDVWFRENNNIWFKTAYEKNLLKPEEMPTGEYDLVEKICQYKKVSFVTFEHLTTITGLTKCKIMKIPHSFATGWHSLLLRENSPYKKIFSRLIKMRISTGMILKYDKGLSFLQAEENLKSIIENGKNSVKIESVKSVFQIIFFIYALAFIILFLECLYKKCEKIRKSKKYLCNEVTKSKI